MTALKDITAKKFGRLTALYKLHNCSKKRVHYLCICDCGNFTEVASNNLTNGKIKSCGCLRGKNHHKCDTRLYRIYYNMKNRCYNKDLPQYKDWGGRGITLCDEWLNDFMAFYNWAIENGYNDSLSIDRVDNDGNYEPLNCRWVTSKQQSRNTRRNNNITINGEMHCLSEWCEILNLNYSNVLSRIYKLNWSIEEALELKERRK